MGMSRQRFKHEHIEIRVAYVADGRIAKVEPSGAFELLAVVMSGSWAVP